VKVRVGEVTVENIDDSSNMPVPMFKEKYAQSPYFAKVVYIQRKVKKFLKKKKLNSPQGNSKYSININAAKQGEAALKNNPPISTNI
jgi:hypothetical protein